MSVINKMLRDLDQRHGAGSTLHLGTASIAATPHQPRRNPRRHVPWARLLALTLLTVLAIGVALWQWGMFDAIARNDKPGRAAPASLIANPEMATATPSPLALPASAVVASAPVLAVSAPDKPVAVPLQASVTASVPVPVPVAVPVLAPPKAVAASAAPSDSNMRTPAAVAQTSISAATAVTQTPGQRQQQAAKDVMVQAQALWSAGSHTAALDLLQESLAIAERSTEAGFGAGAIALVRELTRLQLANGHPAAAWDLLVRLETPLRNEADLWAVRGNAAQRLGRHQDSVHAYLSALQLRPGEQRWLLGAAVSLAALGQTASAVEMAEKARMQGPIGTEVLTYLRQMGVTLADR